MASAERRVALDANVLANIHVCDLLLRLAEEPALYSPVWSEAVLDEVQKTHRKLGWAPDLSDYWRTEVQRAFPEAMSTGWEHLVSQIEVDPKDRHVAAAAVQSGALVIVTFNLKDFPAAALERWQLVAVHPADFLVELYGQHSGIIYQRLDEYAVRRMCTKAELVARLRQWLKSFTDLVEAPS